MLEKPDQFCAGCGAGLTLDDRVASSMSTWPGGDDTFRSWFRCPACGQYTSEQFRDRFCLPPDVCTDGPFTREEVELRLGRALPVQQALPVQDRSR
jgi:hypothetical protein